MKRVNLFLLTAMAVILLAGCKGDEPENQQGEQPNLLQTVNPDTFSFDGAAHAGQADDTKFSVKNPLNNEVTVTVESGSQSWLTIAKTGETASTSLTVPANTEMDIYLSLTHNNMGLPRQGTVTVADGTAVKEIVVKQGFFSYSYKVGDFYYYPVYSDGMLQSDIAAIGMVYWLDTTAPDYDAATKSGLSGKIVSLDHTPNALAWGPGEGSGGVNNMTDGLANMAIIKGLDNTFSNYPAFAWVDQKNGAAGATAYASGDTGIWYLPAVAELQYLLCAAAGKPHETWRFSESDNSGSRYPSFNLDDASIDLSSFNVKLTSVGATALSTLNYWCSTEYDNNSNAWNVRFGNGNTNVGLKLNSSSRARAVRAF